MVNTFCKRWMTEYVPGFTQRKKWNSEQCNLKLGDVVLVVDSAQPRGQWLLGKIEGIHKALDSVVRSVDVKTKYGIFKCPATKICLLEESSV